VPGSLDRSGVALVALVAIAQCLPLWQQHWFDSHESYSYVLRVVEFEAALRQGDLYPRWASDFYGGYGSPFFVFYAPLVFVGGAALSALLGSAVAGLKLWIVLASVASGAGVYTAVKAETQRADAALLAALVYLASAYRLGDIYVRGDIAEYTALALLPWAVAAYRSVARSLSLEVAAVRAALAVGVHAALLFSHAVVGLWGTLLLAALCLGTSYPLWQRRAFRHVGLLGTAFALSLGMSAAYTGPALLEKAQVHIAVARTGYYEPSNQLLPLERLFENGQFGILPVVIAALLLALLAAGLRRGALPALVWAIAAGIFAWLSTRRAEAFWQLQLPLVSFIQFPWRLHGLSALAAAIGLGLAWAALFRQGSWREASALLLGSCALLVSAPSCRVTRSFAAGSFPETTGEIRGGIHHTTAGEYLPLVVTAVPTTSASALVASSPSVQTKRAWSRGSVHELDVVANAPSAVALTLHMFPGWRVDTLAGPAAAELATSQAGLVSLRLPKAGSYRLRVSFGSSPVRAFFGASSLALVFATWPLLRRIARNSAPRGAAPRQVLRQSLRAAA
jgi:uncharacterized membrane protein